MLKILHPFGGSGSQVMKLIKTGAINQALQAYTSQPDAAGAVVLINHYAKSDPKTTCAQVENIYNTLTQARIAPDVALVGTLVNVWRKFGKPEKSLQLIDLVIQLGFVFPVNTFSSLATACVEAGSVNGASKLISHIDKVAGVPTAFAQLIKVYTNSNLVDQAISILQFMEKKGFKASPHIYSSIVACCANTQNLRSGRQMHSKISTIPSFQNNMILQNSLLNMYFKCGDNLTAEQLCVTLERKRQVDAVTWNIMISGRAKSSKQAALDTFISMIHQNVSIERQNITTLFNSCSDATNLVSSDSNERVMDLQYASQLLDIVNKYGNIPFNSIDYAVLIKAYCRGGNVDVAETIFRDMLQKNIPVNAHICASLLAACTENHLKLDMYLTCRRPQQAFKLWKEALKEPMMDFDTALFQAAVSTSAECVAGESIKHIHALYNASGLKSVILETSMINAYACCANLQAAESLFEEMKTKMHDNVTWNAMLKAYPNNTTLLQYEPLMKIQRSYSTLGMGEKAVALFNEMINILPTIEIHNCMVDVFSRSGRLEEAENFINENIEQPNHVTWITYTAGCRILGDIQRAKVGVDKILQIYPDHPATLVLRYASEHDFEGVKRTRLYMHQNRIKKEVGHSWIEVNGKVHSFMVNDRNHPEAEKIYAEINKMRVLALDAGFQPKTCLVLHDISEEQKEETLWYHCEKIAVAYGIISTPSTTELVVKKNLRMCEDCHEAIKYVSKIYKRRINVADTARWHVFDDGKCSCNDYF